MEFSHLTDKELAALAYHIAKTPLEKELAMRFEKKEYFVVCTNNMGTVLDVQKKLFQ